MLRLPKRSCLNLFLIALIINLPQSLFGQQDNAGHLLQLLETVTEKVDRVDILTQLAWVLRRSDNSQAEAYAKEARWLANYIGDKVRYQRVNRNLAVILTYQSQLAEAKALVEEAWDFFTAQDLSLDAAKTALVGGSLATIRRAYTTADSVLATVAVTFEQYQDTISWIDALRLRGFNYYRQQQYLNSCEWYFKAIDLCYAKEEKVRLVQTLNGLGVNMKRLYQPAEALTYYLEALSLTTDPLLRAQIANNISNVYQELGDWKRAQTFQEQALALKRELGLPLPIAHSLNNLGTIHKNQLNYGEGLSLLRESLAIKDTLQKGNLERSKTINNIGNIYKELGQYTTAIDYYQQFFQLAVDEQDSTELCRAHHNLADVYERNQNYDLAEPHAAQCLTLANNIDNLEFKQKAHQRLASLRSRLGDYENSYRHQQIAATIQDSLLDVEKLRAVVAVEQREAVVALRQSLGANKREKSTEVEQFGVNRSSPWIWWVGLIFASAGGGYYWYYRRRELSKVNAKLDTILQLYANASSIEKQQSPIVDMGSFLENKLQDEADWRSFEHYFERIYPDFYERLKQQCTVLTGNEMRHCALLKLNLQNKEIARILHVSPDGVRKAQQRLGKKLDLPTASGGVRDFMLAF